MPLERGNMHSLRALVFVGLFSPLMAFAASGYEIRDFKAEEAQIHTREFKKVEVSAIIEIAPGMPEPALNLVQVTEQGDRLRFLGIILYNPKKGRWSRKVELLEREPGRLYFEIVPEGELEPFQVRPRQRAVIEVFKRPSLLEILRGVWDRFTAGWGARIPAASAVALAGEPPFPCLLMPGVNPEGWKPVPASEGMPAGTLGLAAVRKLDDAEKGSVAGLRTTIDHPAARVLELLWDPQHHKNPGNSRITVEPQPDGAKVVSVEASPVFFVKIRWRERWERRGSLITYRKLDGEQKLKHFCGWIEVVADEGSPSRSRVTLYNEILSPGRSPEDMFRGHLSVVRKLGKLGR